MKLRHSITAFMIFGMLIVTGFFGTISSVEGAIITLPGYEAELFTTVTSGGDLRNGLVQIDEAPDGTLFVGQDFYDAHSQIYKIKPDRSWTLFGSPAVLDPDAVTVNSAGTIFTGGDGYIYKLTPSGSSSLLTGREFYPAGPHHLEVSPSDQLFAMGDHSSIPSIYEVSSTGTVSLFGMGESITFDETGNIYILRYEEILVQYTNGTGGTLLTGVLGAELEYHPSGFFLTVGDGVVYLTPLDGSGQVILASGFKFAFDVTVAASGDIFVTDHFDVYRIYSVEEDEPPLAHAGPDQTVYEGDTVQFNGSYSYNETSNWHKLDVNYATDSALHLRKSDPGGPYLGGWEGGVMEWVTFSSPQPFWIGKRPDHMGQGPAGKDYTYYWKMHQSGNFTLYIRAGNGWFTADVYDETVGAYVVTGLYAYQGSSTSLQYLESGHIYRVDIHSSGVLSGFPNDLDVKFKIEETDILLTPDLNSLVYYVSETPLLLATEGPGVTSITFFSRGEQEFYTNYAGVLDHSEDVMSGGELSLAPDPYKTGITPGEYVDTPLDGGDPTEPVLSWDFDANFDSDGDGDKTNDIDATGANPSHIYGDDGEYVVTLSVTFSNNLTATDTCNITVLNVDPDGSIESATMDVDIGLRLAGSKWSNVGMSLYEDDVIIGYLEVERWPGNPDKNPKYVNGPLPTSLDLTKSYKAVVTYDPYPDSGDEIKGDQPNNGKDKKNNAGNPVWITLTFPNGSEVKIHHTFNTQQSMIRDSEHPNHVEPWEVDINSNLTGWEFEVDYHVSDPGSDDEILTFTYGSQTESISHLNNPPDPDPYPSPQVNPKDILGTANLVYEGAGTIILNVKDDDNIRLSTDGESVEIVLK